MLKITARTTFTLKKKQFSVLYMEKSSTLSTHSRLNVTYIWKNTIQPVMAGSVGWDLNKSNPSAISPIVIITQSIFNSFIESQYDRTVTLHFFSNDKNNYCQILSNGIAFLITLTSVPQTKAFLHVWNHSIGHLASAWWKLSLLRLEGNRLLKVAQ